MKQLLILLLAFMASCNSQETAQQQEKANAQKQENTHGQNMPSSTLPLNNGAKWKADASTKQNVAAMVQIVDNNIYEDAGKRTALASSMQSQLDTLIKQCRMKGAEHDALHVWLEKVLTDVKSLKEGKEAYAETYVVLKKDIKAFYDVFE